MKLEPNLHYTILCTDYKIPTYGQIMYSYLCNNKIKSGRDGWTDRQQNGCGQHDYETNIDYTVQGNN